jgi:hypothetical protein
MAQCPELHWQLEEYLIQAEKLTLLEGLVQNVKVLWAYSSIFHQLGLQIMSLINKKDYY